MSNEILCRQLRCCHVWFWQTDFDQLQLAHAFSDCCCHLVEKGTWLVNLLGVGVTKSFQQLHRFHDWWWQPTGRHRTIWGRACSSWAARQKEDIDDWCWGLGSITKPNTLKYFTDCHVSKWIVNPKQKIMMDLVYIILVGFQLDVNNEIYCRW